MDAVGTNATSNNHTPRAPIRGPVPKRPLTVLDIADGAFAIIRVRPKTVAAIVAAIVLPVQLVATWLQRDSLVAFDLENYDENGQLTSDISMSSIIGGSMAAAVFGYLILPFIGVALTHLVQGWRAGEDRTALHCLLFTLKKTHIILAAFVLCKIIQLLTLSLATPALMVVAPIIAAEGAGPIRAIKRSWELAKPRLGALFGLVVIIAIVNQLLGMAVGALPIVAAFLLADWGWILFFAVNSINAAVLTVLGVGAAVLVYDDLRNRNEGRDLQERIQEYRLQRDAL